MRFKAHFKSFTSLLLIAITLLTSSVLTVGAASSGFTNFSRNRNYVPGQFSDVSESDWYAGFVSNAYELGLVSGTGKDTFSPDKNITLAETLTIASQLHNTYHGHISSFSSSIPWYQTYVDYAINNGIISESQFSNYDAITTRSEFAVIFANALPKEALAPINNISEIPDVTPSSPNGSAIYSLYNAGVISGTDASGSFNPISPIKRSEVATIVSCMAEPSIRKTFTLKTKGDLLQEASFDTLTNWISTYGATTLGDQQAFKETVLSSGAGVEDKYWYALDYKNNCILVHHVVIINRTVHCVDLRLTREGQVFPISYSYYADADDEDPSVRGKSSLDASAFSYGYRLNFTSFSALPNFNHIRNLNSAQDSATQILQGTLDHLNTFFEDTISAYGHCSIADFGFTYLS